MYQSDIQKWLADEDDNDGNLALHNLFFNITIHQTYVYTYLKFSEGIYIIYILFTDLQPSTTTTSSDPLSPPLIQQPDSTNNNHQIRPGYQL